MNRIVAIAPAMLLSLAVVSSPLLAQVCGGTPAKVDLQVSFAPYAGNVANFVAREKGYYKDIGVEVNVIGGTGSASTATNVDQGTVMFGESDIQSVIVNRSKGQKVK